MSRASKLTLAGTSLFAVSTVFFVHYAQQAEKAAMHQGVVRDIEQQRLKKERQLDFDLQRAMEEEYRKVQNVTDGGGSAPVALNKPQ
ncbi:cytochrome c oxidase assembly protein [Phlyctema vagabunda]|uniref:Cytochrome c oxidase assembly protein n=1 Tax=Phlyctema vagabunda TaxID=108571 RepID=A0ABR4PGW0_9HELO